MRGIIATFGVALALALGAAVPARAADLAISCGALGRELDLCREAVAVWERQTGHHVRIVSTPNSATERLALYQQILAARSADIDIYEIDVVWPGILANHFIDLSRYLDRATIAQHFPALIANDTVGGALVALPWFVDAGLLYYRRDLLDKYGRPVPATWQDLTRTARAVVRAERAAGRARMQGFVFQAKGYEGLTCNALEWIASFGGGTIVAADGAVTVDNPRAAAALRLAASWVGDIAPEGVLGYDEEQSRGVFQSGNAVFMRNWPYAWALVNGPDSPVRGRVGVAALPAGGEGGRHVAVLGGWQLAVSRYSAHPAIAADLVRYLASAPEQKRRALAAAYNPSIPALYRDPELLAAAPFLGTLYDTFAHALARPSAATGVRFNRVSADFYGTVHDVLAGRETAEPALAELARRLGRLFPAGREEEVVP